MIPGQGGGFDLETIPLSMLGCGERGEISQVVGQPDLVHRLREMGLHDGVEIAVLRAGSPCIVSVDGQRLCFRDGESFSILVRSGSAV